MYQIDFFGYFEFSVHPRVATGRKIFKDTLEDYQLPPILFKSSGK